MKNDTAESQETNPQNATFEETEYPEEGAVQLYAEPLPMNCPPIAAEEPISRKVWRIVPNEAPAQIDFKSHALTGKSCPPEVCECRKSSCSVFTPSDKKPFVFKLPKFKNQFAATLNISERSGKIIENTETGHIDLWMYKNFDPLLHITDVVKISDLFP